MYNEQYRAIIIKWIIANNPNVPKKGLILCNRIYYLSLQILIDIDIAINMHYRVPCLNISFILSIIANSHYQNNTDSLAVICHWLSLPFWESQLLWNDKMCLFPQQVVKDCRSQIEHWWVSSCNLTCLVSDMHNVIINVSCQCFSGLDYSLMHVSLSLVIYWLLKV